MPQSGPRSGGAPHGRSGAARARLALWPGPALEGVFRRATPTPLPHPCITPLGTRSSRLSMRSSWRVPQATGDVAARLLAARQRSLPAERTFEVKRRTLLVSSAEAVLILRKNSGVYLLDRESLSCVDEWPYRSILGVRTCEEDPTHFQILVEVECATLGPCCCALSGGLSPCANVIAFPSCETDLPVCARARFQLLARVSQPSHWLRPLAMAPRRDYGRTLRQRLPKHPASDQCGAQEAVAVRAFGTQRLAALLMRGVGPNHLQGRPGKSRGRALNGAPGATRHQRPARRAHATRSPAASPGSPDDGVTIPMAGSR